MDILGSAGLAATSGLIVGGTIFADGTHVDDRTSVSLQMATVVAVTVFMCGMWISRKLTRIEDRLDESERLRLEGIGRIEKRIEELPCREWQHPNGSCNKRPGGPMEGS